MPVDVSKHWAGLNLSQLKRAKGGSLFVQKIFVGTRNTAMANPQNAPLQEELYLVLYVDQVYDGKGKNQEIALDSTLSNWFGLIAVNEWPIYDGPDTSKLEPVAWTRGQHMGSAMGCPRWLLTCNIVFADKSRHAGSTLAVMGTIVDKSAQGEWAIVGGTGNFTFAQGAIYYEVVKTYTKNDDAKDGELKRLHIQVQYRPVKRSGLRHVFGEFSPSEVDDGIKGKEPIGAGGFGSVFQANIRGTTVAVKILMKRHGLKANKDFKREIEIFKTIRHENLVTLVGACMEKWALIYEFCPKGTLGDRLFPPTTTSSSSSSSSTLQEWKPLSWEERVRAASGICSGLEFLHALRIAHCDLKPNNILFNAQDVCKICDFGLVRPLRLTRDTATPVHYTGPMGTPSYWDPEFIQNRKGKLTRKSDVYALGIILLQLVTGRGAHGLRDSVSKVRDQAGVGDIENICQQLVDPNILDDLKATSKQEDALKMIDLGLQCSSDTRKQRPDVATLCPVIESMLNAG